MASGPPGHLNGTFSGNMLGGRATLRSSPNLLGGSLNRQSQDMASPRRRSLRQTQAQLDSLAKRHQWELAMAHESLADEDPFVRARKLEKLKQRHKAHRRAAEAGNVDVAFDKLLASSAPPHRSIKPWEHAEHESATNTPGAKGRTTRRFERAFTAESLKPMEHVALDPDLFGEDDDDDDDDDGNGNGNDNNDDDDTIGHGENGTPHGAPRASDVLERLRDTDAAAELTRLSAHTYPVVISVLASYCDADHLLSRDGFSAAFESLANEHEEHGILLSERDNALRKAIVKRIFDAYELTEGRVGLRAVCAGLAIFFKRQPLLPLLQAVFALFDDDEAGMLTEHDTVALLAALLNMLRLIGSVGLADQPHHQRMCNIYGGRRASLLEEAYRATRDVFSAMLGVNTFGKVLHRAGESGSLLLSRDAFVRWYLGLPTGAGGAADGEGGADGTFGRTTTLRILRASNSRSAAPIRQASVRGGLDGDGDAVSDEDVGGDVAAAQERSPVPSRQPWERVSSLEATAAAARNAGPTSATTPNGIDAGTGPGGYAYAVGMAFDVRNSDHSGAPEALVQEIMSDPSKVAILTGLADQDLSVVHNLFTKALIGNVHQSRGKTWSVFCAEMDRIAPPQRRADAATASRERLRRSVVRRLFELSQQGISPRAPSIRVGRLERNGGGGASRGHGHGAMPPMPMPRTGLALCASLIIHADAAGVDTPAKLRALFDLYGATDDAYNSAEDGLAFHQVAAMLTTMLSVAARTGAGPGPGLGLGPGHDSEAEREEAEKLGFDAARAAYMDSGHVAPREVPFARLPFDTFCRWYMSTVDERKEQFRARVFDNAHHNIIQQNLWASNAGAEAAWAGKPSDVMKLAAMRSDAIREEEEQQAQAQAQDERDKAGDDDLLNETWETADDGFSPRTRENIFGMYSAGAGDVGDEDDVDERGRLRRLVDPAFISDAYRVFSAHKHARRLEEDAERAAWEERMAMIAAEDDDGEDDDDDDDEEDEEEEDDGGNFVFSTPRAWAPGDEPASPPASYRNGDRNGSSSKTKRMMTPGSPSLLVFRDKTKAQNAATQSDASAAVLASCRVAFSDWVERAKRWVRAEEVYESPTKGHGGRQENSATSPSPSTRGQGNGDTTPGAPPRYFFSHIPPNEDAEGGDGTTASSSRSGSGSSSGGGVGSGADAPGLTESFAHKCDVILRSDDDVSAFINSTNKLPSHARRRIRANVGRWILDRLSKKEALDVTARLVVRQSNSPGMGNGQRLLEPKLVLKKELSARSVQNLLEATGDDGDRPYRYHPVSAPASATSEAEKARDAIEYASSPPAYEQEIATLQMQKEPEREPWWWLKGPSSGPSQNVPPSPRSLDRSPVARHRVSSGAQEKEGQAGAATPSAAFTGTHANKDEFWVYSHPRSGGTQYTLSLPSFFDGCGLDEFYPTKREGGSMTLAVDVSPRRVLFSCTNGPGVVVPGNEPEAAMNRASAILDRVSDKVSALFEARVYMGDASAGIMPMAAPPGMTHEVGKGPATYAAGSGAARPSGSSLSSAELLTLPDENAVRFRRGCLLKYGTREAMAKALKEAILASKAKFAQEGLAPYYKRATAADLGRQQQEY